MRRWDIRDAAEMERHWERWDETGVDWKGDRNESWDV